MKKNMAQRGRPASENTKDIQLKIRADAKLIEDIDFCCEKLNLTKSSLIREGIAKIKSELVSQETKSTTTKTINFPKKLLPEEQDIQALEKVLEILKNLEKN